MQAESPETLQKLTDNPYFDIWDVDYFSTSDEEDEDDDDGSSSESSDDESSPQKVKPDTNEPSKSKGIQKKNEKKEETEDVVSLLIQRDKTLARRDVECKLFKLRNKKNLRKKIFMFDELAESPENFKKWWKQDLPNVYFAMSSRHRTCYRKGDQLLNSYGMRSNRFLLTNYGVTIR